MPLLSGLNYLQVYCLFKTSLTINRFMDTVAFSLVLFMVSFVATSGQEPLSCVPYCLGVSGANGHHSCYGSASNISRPIDCQEVMKLGATVTGYDLYLFDLRF